MNKENLSHNDIVLKLDDKILINIFKDYFGIKSSFSAFHFIHQKEIKDYTMEEMNLMSSKFLKEELIKTKIDTIRHLYILANKQIIESSIEDSFEIDTNFEFPLIKGEGAYQTTKGFLDVIVHMKPLKIAEFCCYKNESPKEFIIEIKKEKDFEDFGNILRQIKEYRVYYNYSCQKWNSDIISKFSISRNTFFVVLADKIPDNVKKLFNDEDIITISLNDYIKEDIQKELI
jgi:hypothetical protein